MGDRATAFMTVTVLMLLTVIVVFAMKYLSAARGVRISVAKDDELRELARRAIAASEESATALSALKASVLDMQSRLSHIETILKDVQ